MTHDDELVTLHRILEAARMRVLQGDDRAQPIVIAVGQMIAERERDQRASSSDQPTTSS
jgi:hypothetical protein